jgi:dienelactone hydrolase
MKRKIRLLLPLLFAVMTIVPPITEAEEAASSPQGSAWLDAAGLPPPLKVPATLPEWQTQRQKIRAQLHTLLGDLPHRPAQPQVTILSREEHDSYTQEKFEFDNGAGETVRGYSFVPKTASTTAKAPAILYCHWHGGQYDSGKQEMLQTNAVPTPPGPALAKQGYVVLGIDACGFGERNGMGPDGPQQKGSHGEMTAAKFNLWLGRTMWGMIIRDDLMALDYLSSRPEVDAARIGVTGISMGSTRAWWLMALDDRLKAAVCVACMTRYEELIRANMLKAHGIYYFVPGMMKHFDAEAVIALGAPRPMLFMTGDEDSGSPVVGIRKIEEAVRKVYVLHGAGEQAHFESIVYPRLGHVYLPEMWEKTVAWFGKWLKP